MSGSSIYITIGMTIIAALVAALIGPFFVDWDSYKPAFERAGSRLFGAPVAIQGGITARLLPTPALDMTSIVVGDLANPTLRISRYRMQLDIAPLLKGEFVVSELELDQPQLFLGLDEAGRLDLGPREPTDNSPDEIANFSVEKTTIRGGVVDFRDARNGRKLRIDTIDATASLASLAGPFKLEGDGRFGERPIGLRLNAGRRGDTGALPLKIAVSSPADEMALAFDIAVDTGAGGAQPVHVAGGMTAQRVADTGKGDRANRAATPWRLDAKLDGRPDALALTDVQLAIGQDDRSLSLAGRGRVMLAGGQPRYELALTGRQLDLDRLFPARPGNAPDPADAIHRTLGLIAGINRLDLDGRLTLDIPALVLGGSLAQDLHVDLRPRVNAVDIDDLSLRLPGRSRVSARGRLTTSGPPTALRPGAFEGSASLASEQPQLFAAWLRRDKVGSLVPAFSLAGKLNIDGDSSRLDDATLTLGGATASGALSLKAPPGKPRAIAARLRADSLDVDRLRAFATLLGVTGEGSGTAFGSAALDLDVGSLAAADVTAKGVTAKVQLDGDKLVVDHLTVADVEGAALKASGTVDRVFTAPEGRLRATLRVERADAVERIAARLLTGDTLGARAATLVPLTVEFDLKADAARRASTLAVDAKAAETRLSARAEATGTPDKWREAQLRLETTLSTADANQIARQFGLSPASAATSPGAAQLKATATGPAGGALALTAELSVGALKGSLSGTAHLADAAPRLDGTVKFATPDSLPVASLIGLPSSAGAATAPLAADLSAKLGLADGGVTITNLSGRIGATKLDGALTLTPPPMQLAGNLTFSTLDAGALVEALIGRGALTAPKAKANDVWPTARLAGPIGLGVPADLAISAEKLTLDGAGHALDEARFRLGLVAGEARLDELTGGLGGGRVVAGRLGVRRGTLGDLSLEGTLSLQKVRLETPWKWDGRDVASGLLDAEINLTAEGATLPALIVGSAGGGRYTLANAELRGLDPIVFPTVVTAIDGGADLREERLRALALPKLDGGALTGAHLTGTVSLAAGVVRLRDAVAEGPTGRAAAVATIDLNQWSLDAMMALAGPSDLAAGNGTPPRLAFTFKGSVDKPERRADLSQLLTWTASRIIDRDERARQEMEARLKRDEEARLKREEEARKREEEARLKREEEARKREEESRQREDEIRRAVQQQMQQPIPARPTGQTPAPASAQPQAPNAPAQRSAAPAATPANAVALPAPTIAGPVPPATIATPAPKPSASPVTAQPSPPQQAAPSTLPPAALAPLPPIKQILPAPGPDAPLVILPRGTR